MTGPQRSPIFAGVTRCYVARAALFSAVLAILVWVSAKCWVAYAAPEGAGPSVDMVLGAGQPNEGPAVDLSGGAPQPTKMLPVARATVTSPSEDTPPAPALAVEPAPEPDVAPAPPMAKPVGEADALLAAIRDAPEDGVRSAMVSEVNRLPRDGDRAAAIAQLVDYLAVPRGDMVAQSAFAVFRKNLALVPARARPVISRYATAGEFATRRDAKQLLGLLDAVPR